MDTTERSSEQSAVPAYEPPSVTVIGTIEELTLVDIDAGAAGTTKPT